MKPQLLGKRKFNLRIHNNFSKHHVECSWDELKETYKNPHAWIMDNPKSYSKPIPYEHPKGAIIWVKS